MTFYLGHFEVALSHYFRLLFLMWHISDCLVLMLDLCDLCVAEAAQSGKTHLVLGG